MKEKKKKKAKRSPGLRKYVPQPEIYAERYGNLTLTPRDLDILELIYHYRHLEARHIKALIPGSDQQIDRRLHGLFHNLYVARYVPRERMRLDLNQGSPRIAYGLETKGWRVLEEHRRHLAEEGTAEFEPVKWKKDYTRRQEWFLEHSVMRSTFHATLQLAFRDDPNRELVQWVQGEDCGGSVKLSSGREYWVKPDAYCSIQEAGVLRHYFLEFDRSSMDLISGNEAKRTIEKKLTSYWWYLQSPAYIEAHENYKRVAVLFVTTGKTRLANMMSLLAGEPRQVGKNRKMVRRFQEPNRPEAGGKGWFLFCLEQNYTLEDPQTLLQPIWRTAVRPNKLRSLI